MEQVNTYWETCQEVCEVLKRLPRVQLKLIPREVVANIQINARKSGRKYELKTDVMHRLILSKQAEEMLLALYSQYFLDKKTNKILKQKLQENENRAEIRKKENYNNPQDIFYRTKSKKSTISEEKKELIVVEEKQGFFYKLIQFVRKIIKSGT